MVHFRFLWRYALRMTLWLQLMDVKTWALFPGLLLILKLSWLRGELEDRKGLECHDIKGAFCDPKPHFLLIIFEHFHKCNSELAVFIIKLEILSNRIYIAWITGSFMDLANVHLNKAFGAKEEGQKGIVSCKMIFARMLFCAKKFTFWKSCPFSKLV